MAALCLAVMHRAGRGGGGSRCAKLRQNPQLDRRFHGGHVFLHTARHYVPQAVRHEGEVAEEVREGEGEGKRSREQENNEI